nr:hypothetical protein [Burkholderia oklahomensis]
MADETMPVRRAFSRSARNSAADASGSHREVDAVEQPMRLLDAQRHHFVTVRPDEPVGFEPLEA